MLTAEAAQDRPDGISPTALDALDAMVAAAAAQPEAALNAGHEAALDAGVQASQRAPEVASVRCAGVCTPLSPLRGRVHTIEFQKRGLPHAHMLLIREDKLAPDYYDSFPLPLLPLLLPLSGLLQVDTPPERDVAILKRVLPLGEVRLV